MTDPWDQKIYLPTWMVDFHGINVGKYTSPMDPMGSKAAIFCDLWPFLGIVSELYKFTWSELKGYLLVTSKDRGTNRSMGLEVICFLFLFFVAKETAKLDIWTWAVLMRKRLPFSLLNDEQMSNKVRVEHQPVFLKLSTLPGDSAAITYLTFGSCELTIPQKVTTRIAREMVVLFLYWYIYTLGFQPPLKQWLLI